MLREKQHFKRSQIFVHWLSALLIITVIALPVGREFFAEQLGGMAQVFMWHKSLAIIIFVLTLLRIAMMLKMGRPATLQTPDKAFYRVASRATEGLFYLMLLALPTFGFLMSSQPINFFNLTQIQVLNLSESLRGTFHTLHIYTAYTLTCLIGLHLTAALFHYFILRDNVMSSMLTSKED